MNTLRAILFALIVSSACAGLMRVNAADAPTEREVKNISVKGEMDEERAQLIINAQLKDPQSKSAKVLHSISINHRLAISREQIKHTFNAKCSLIQGEPEEIVLQMDGVGEIRQVKGDLLRDWSVRQDADGKQSLIVRLVKPEKPLNERTFMVSAETKLGDLPQTLSPAPPDTPPHSARSTPPGD